VEGIGSFHFEKIGDFSVGGLAIAIGDASADLV
jgi:hypothetical protein